MARRLAVTAVLVGVVACGGSDSPEASPDAASGLDGSDSADGARGLEPDATSTDASPDADGQSTLDTSADGDASGAVDANTGADGNVSADASAGADAAPSQDASDATAAEASVGPDAGAAHGDDASSEGGLLSDAGVPEADATASDGGERDVTELDANDANASDAAPTDSSADAPDAQCGPVPACTAKSWTQVLGAAGDATISSCGMRLQSNSTVRVAQGSLAAFSGIDGDFTLVVDFLDFAYSQVGSAFADATFGLENGGATLYGAITTGSSSAAGYVIASVLPIGQVSPTDNTIATTGRSGTMTFTRSGTVGTIAVDAGGVVAFESGDIGSNTIYPFFETTSGNGSVSITIQSIQLSAGTGTFQSDAFTCNGL